MDARVLHVFAREVAKVAADAGDRERFWEKVRKGGPDECWSWRASDNSDGYPKIRWNGVLTLASHVAYELDRGQRPHGILSHTCDNTGCLNPRHLRSTTQKQNLKQMRDRGRVRPRGVAQEPDVRR